MDTGLDRAVAVSDAYASTNAEAAGPKVELPSSLAVPSALVEVKGAGARALAKVGAALRVKIGNLTMTPEEPSIVSRMPARRPFQIAGFLGNALWKRGKLVVDTRARRLSISSVITR